MTFLMANKIKYVLLVCVLYRLLLWSIFLLVKVGAARVWPTSLLSTHMFITNKSIWLHPVGSRLGVLSPCCSSSISSVNGDCIVNETLDALPRITISFWINQDFVFNIFFQPRKKPFHPITIKIGMWEHKCWNSLAYSFTYILIWERRWSSLCATIFGLTHS